MVQLKLYDPNRGIMRIGILMSGSGTNARKIIEHQRILEKTKSSPYEVVAIFSDKAKSNAVEIGRTFDIPALVRDIDGFYDRRGFSSTRFKDHPEVRELYDYQTKNLLSSLNIDVLALAGYMSAITNPLIDSYLIVNVHPADLSIKEGNKRKYTGDKAVLKALLAREKHLRSTTHIVEPKIDYGRILMISEAVDVMLPNNFDFNNEELVKEAANIYQSKLKTVGDWQIYPRTLEYLAQGRFSQDRSGLLYFDYKAIPEGLSLSKLGIIN